jgi:Fic family protein
MVLLFQVSGYYMINRAGKSRNNLSGEAAYRSFVPSPLPPRPGIETNADLAEALVKAHKQLAVLDRSAACFPNIELVISMYVYKEALMSSQIEGTQATLEDIFNPLNDKNINRDVADVINYVKALKFAVGRLAELPLCNRLIQETHAVLLAGLRGAEKSPGEFRRSQNWIGGGGSTIKNARYIPPNPHDMTEAISALERYINADDDLDILVRAALVHYQFETIHPFLDGNGRIGRLLITLFLMVKGALSTPALYISYYLKRNRIEYYDRMNEVREKGNFEQWILFFLQAVYESARDAVNSMDKLTVLHDKNSAVIQGFGRSAGTCMRLFNYLEANPIIDIQKTATALDASFNTAAGAVKRLLKAGILLQTAGGRRNRVFSYGAYLDILRDGTM